MCVWLDPARGREPGNVGSDEPRAGDEAVLPPARGIRAHSLKKQTTTTLRNRETRAQRAERAGERRRGGEETLLGEKRVAFAKYNIGRGVCGGGRMLLVEYG